MHSVALALIPWLDPQYILDHFGAIAVLVVCAIVFAETGLLIGFVFPGDSLLVITGLFAFDRGGSIGGIPIWVAALMIGAAAFLGGELGYYIGKKAGPPIFERKESGLFSKENVDRTNAFFHRFGPLAVILARFVPVVRTFAPIAAGVGRMNYKKYSLYNAIGAVIWGVGVTFLGYFLGYIPPIAYVVRNYIDVILILAVVVTVVPAGLHYWRTARKAKHAAEAEQAAQTRPTARLAPDPLTDPRTDAEWRDAPRPPRRPRNRGRLVRPGASRVCPAGQTPKYSRTIGAIPRNAFDRCDSAFFSSRVSCAAEPSASSGWKTGSYPCPPSPTGSVRTSPFHTASNRCSVPSGVTNAAAQTKAAVRSTTPSRFRSRSAMLSASTRVPA